MNKQLFSFVIVKMSMYSTVEINDYEYGLMTLK